MYPCFLNLIFSTEKTKVEKKKKKSHILSSVEFSPIMFKTNVKVGSELLISILKRLQNLINGL